MRHYRKRDHSGGLHTSRTLDQYYYVALADTSRRDMDQVIRRYQMRKLSEASKILTMGSNGVSFH